MQSILLSLKCCLCEPYYHQTSELTTETCPSSEFLHYLLYVQYIASLCFPFGSAGKESVCHSGDLGCRDPLEKEKATHSSILAWRIPWTICSMGTWNMSELQRVRHAWVTFPSLASLAHNLTLFIISLCKFLPPTNTYKHTHAYT